MLETRVIDIDGVPVRYAAAGQGSALVLVHGLSGSWTWWRRNVPALKERHTLYLLDLPGFGSMRAHYRQFSLARATHWVRSVLQAIGLQRPSIVGHSMGGAIALLFAARWPDELDRLVLAAPAVNLPYRSVFRGLGPLAMAASQAQLQFAPILLYDALRAGPATLIRAAHHLFAIDIAQDLAAVRSETLMIWGDRDSLVPVETGRMLRRDLPSSRLCVIEGAAHVVMFDRPREFNRAVLDFLAGVPVEE